MNKNAIRTFAIWARNKLMTDIESNAYLIGITKEGVKDPLPQSTKDMQYFDVGSATPYALDKKEITKRDKLKFAMIYSRIIYIHQLQLVQRYITLHQSFQELEQLDIIS